MYKIGQTDGVAKCCSNVGVPVACIKTYLMKMAKSAADLPCACKAKSDMQVLASGEFKASTSSCCAGGTSSKTGCGGGGCCCGGCCGKSCCGGKGCPPNLYSGSGANDEKTKDTLDLAAAQEQAAFAEEEAQNQPQTQIADAFQSTEGGTTVQQTQNVPENNPSVTDKITAGVQAVGGKILSTIDDVLTSEIPANNQSQWETARDFQTEVCQNRPYPECQYCQYATTIMSMSDFDIVDYLNGIKDCLKALNQGEVGWAEQRFVCPGQIAAMLGDEFGEVGLLAGRTAAAAIIGSMALHGALKSVRSFSRQAATHDLRCELTSVLCNAIKSGGGGDNYVELLNDIMCNLGVDSKDLFRSNSWSKGNRTCGGGSQRTTSTRQNETCGRTPVSESAKKAAESVKSVTSALTKQPDNPGGVIVNGGSGSGSGGGGGGGTPSPTPTPTPTTPTKTTFVPCTDRTVQLDPSNPVTIIPGQGSFGPISKDTLEPNPKTYFYIDPVDGTHKPLPVQPKLNEPLAKYEQEYGPLYTQNDVTELVDVISKTPAPALEIANNLVEESKRTGTPLEDLIEEMIETSAASDAKDQSGPKINGSAISAGGTGYSGGINVSTITPGNTAASARAKQAAANAAGAGVNGDWGEGGKITVGNGGAPTINVNDVSPVISAEKVSTEKGAVPTPDATEMAYDSAVIPVSGGSGSASKALFENDLVDGRDAGKDPETIIAAARALETLSRISEPIVLSNKLALEPVVSVDSKDYEDNVIFTPSLVTRNQVPASQMAKLAGIDLTEYDLYMAYALDHDVNGSILPRDVHAIRIPTILDTFPVW